MPHFTNSRAPTARRTALASAIALLFCAAAHAGGLNDKSTGDHVSGIAMVVDNCNDSGAGSLRQAFADAVAANAVAIDARLLDCPLIELSSAIRVLVPDLQLLGPGQDVLEIRGNDADRVLDTDFNLTISNVRISHGRSATGAGGCINAIGDLALVNSTVTGCHAGGDGTYYSKGGAVHTSGDLTLDTTTISDSDAVGTLIAAGGGAYTGGDATLTASTITSNHSISTSENAFGGGLWVRGTTTVSASRIADNEARSTDGAAYGGGLQGLLGLISIDTASVVTGNVAHSDTKRAYGGGISAGLYSGIESVSIFVTDSRIGENTASSDCAACAIRGGGAHAFGQIQLSDSTVDGNAAIGVENSAAVASGGGIATSALYEEGSVVTANATISGNRATAGALASGRGYGGGIAMTGESPFLILNSTIAFNEASHAAGGVTASDASGDTPRLYSSIIANNVATEGADIAASTPGDSSIVDGEDNLVVNSSQDVQLPDDTVFTDPALLTLADNGGPTATHALAPCSPAIDAGSNGFGLNADQRRDPFVREFGLAADIGAFETQPDADRIWRGDFDRWPCPASP